MCRVIVIANQKGGIGKTTTAVSLATTLESIGKRTLLIDCDPQCNSTDVYGAEMNGVTTLYDLIIEQNVEDPMEAVQKTSVGEIVAGDHLLVKSEVVFLQDPVEGIYRLQKAIAPLRDVYDFIIMDTNPALNQLLYNCLVAADEVIIPVIADRFSLAGLQQIVDTINAVKSRPNPNVKLAGFLLIKYKKNLRLEREVRESLKTIAESIGTKLFDSYIRESVKLRESQSLHDSIIKYAPNNICAIDYLAFAKELIGEESSNG